MNIEIEIWKDVPGYEGLYQCSNFGRVKSFIYKKERILKSAKNNKGYLNVILTKNKTHKQFKCHRLVLMSFIGVDIYKKEVNHINNIKHDNRLENLEWVTPKENVIHSFRTKLRNNVIGERCFKSKLTSIQVLEIRSIGRTKTLKEISEIYKIKEPSVWQIITKKSWKHI